MDGIITKKKIYIKMTEQKRHLFRSKTIFPKINVSSAKSNILFQIEGAIQTEGAIIATVIFFRHQRHTRVFFSRQYDK